MPTTRRTAPIAAVPPGRRPGHGLGLSLAPARGGPGRPGRAQALPRRPLGKTGVEITLLDQGAVRGPSLDRIFRFAFANGIRTFDTARVYGSEPDFKKWFDRLPRSARKSSWSPRIRRAPRPRC
jgi:hypothetical protein